MKTKTMGLFTFPVLAAIMIASTITPALAEGANPEQAADIQMDEGCSLNTGLTNAGLNQFGTATATDVIEVHTNNQNGTALFSCNGELDDLSLAPDRAVKGTFESSFTNSETGDVVLCYGQIVVTPSGNVSLTCRG